MSESWPLGRMVASAVGPAHSEQEPPAPGTHTRGAAGTEPHRRGVWPGIGQDDWPGSAPGLQTALVFPTGPCVLSGTFWPPGPCRSLGTLGQILPDKQEAEGRWGAVPELLPLPSPTQVRPPFPG